MNAFITAHIANFVIKIIIINRLSSLNQIIDEIFVLCSSFWKITPTKFAYFSNIIAKGNAQLDNECMCMWYNVLNGNDVAAG
jgi:hypothetical protein